MNLIQVEMWLHATSAAVNGQRLVEEGEAVLMEVSRKFTMADVRSLAFKSGWFIQVDSSSASALTLVNACELLRSTICPLEEVCVVSIVHVIGLGFQGCRGYA